MKNVQTELKFHFLIVGKYKICANGEEMIMLMIITLVENLSAINKISGFCMKVFIFNSKFFLFNFKMVN